MGWNRPLVSAPVPGQAVAVALLIDMKKMLPELQRRAFLVLLMSEGVGKPETEWRFHPVRRWRFDYAWPDKKVALEVEGGAYSRGRHTRGKGFIADMLKYNTATVMGWKVLRVTPDNLCTLDTVGLILDAHI